jgi:hypothetical protein
VHFNVTAKVGRQLVWKMNDEGATQLLPSDNSQKSYLAWVEEQSLRDQHASQGSQTAFTSEKGIDKSRYGYVTVDSCGDRQVETFLVMHGASSTDPGQHLDRGDDIDHVPCKFE